MRKVLTLLLAAVPFAASAQATYDEGLSFSARATVEADAKLSPGLHLLAHEEMRYYTGDRDFLRSYTGIGLEVKVLPFLKLGAEYELINRYKYDEELKANAWTRRHRGNFFLTGTWKTPYWQFGLKETLRLTHRPDDMNTLQAPRNALALKSKVSVKYRGWEQVVPYAAFELRNTLNDAAYSGTYHASATESKDIYTSETFLGYTHAYVNRFRLQLGVSVKFDKRHEVDFYLLGDHYRDKQIDTNREGSTSWSNNGLVLKSIDWYTGNMLSAGVGYKWSF